MTQPRKAVTLDDIAKMARTTKSTVSRVLSDHPRISGKTKARVIALIRKHKFQPNFSARALARGRTGIIGVLASNISSGFFADVIRGIDLVAIEQRGHLLCSFAHGNEDYVRLWYELAHGGQVEGLILVDPPLDLLGMPFARPGIPLALCASWPDGDTKGWTDLDSATVDNRKAMAWIVEHLYANGCRTILHLAGHENIYDAQERRLGFLAACRRHRDITSQVLGGHLIQDDGVRAIRKLLDRRAPLPDAVVAFNDSTALGVMEGLNLLAPKKAGTIALTGWDDSPSAAVLGLTSVRMPITELGQQSARLLYARLGATQKKPAPASHAVLDCALIERASTARARCRR